MRPIERIDNFLNKVDWSILKDKWSIEWTYFDDILSQPLTYCKFRKYWKENPDQRIGQVLINLGLIPDLFQAWNDEESEILEAQGLAPEEYLFWGSIYDKDMNPIPLTQRLIKDMDTDHIEKVLSLFTGEKRKLTTEYITAFTNVLKSRNRNYSIDDFDHYHSFYTMNNTNNND
jgi:hypothetical protein